MQQPEGKQWEYLAIDEPTDMYRTRGTIHTAYDKVCPSPIHVSCVCICV